MIPEMMTAMVFEDINVIRARQVPVPKPKRGEALVKIMASGLCITDVHVLQGLFAHSKPPCVMGHEDSALSVCPAIKIFASTGET